MLPELEDYTDSVGNVDAYGWPLPSSTLPAPTGNPNGGRREGTCNSAFPLGGECGAHGCRLGADGRCDLARYGAAQARDRNSISIACSMSACVLVSTRGRVVDLVVVLVVLDVLDSGFPVIDDVEVAHRTGCRGTSERGFVAWSALERYQVPVGRIRAGSDGFIYHRLDEPHP